MGRPAGSLNTSTLVGRQQLARYVRAAEEFTYSVMQDRVRCSVCDGEGKQPIEGQQGKFHDRKCSSCKGRGREIIKTETRLQAAFDIQDRAGVARQKQTDHVSTDGSHVTGIRIISVAANAVREGTSPARLMESHERSNSGD